MADDIRQLGSISEFGKITASTATTIFTAKGKTTIRSLVVTENSGATPNLTVDVYDVANTTSYYPGATNATNWKARAVSAGQAVTFNEKFDLPALWAIRITSSDAAGKFDWFLTYDNPVAAARGR